MSHGLFEGLSQGIAGVALNGPALDRPDWRLPGNLNVSFENLDGESLLMSTKDVAASSGSACTSSHPEPSHVLRALGIGDERAQSSVRFGLGRFNTAAEVEYVIAAVADAAGRLRKMGSLPVLRSDG